MFYKNQREKSGGRGSYFQDTFPWKHVFLFKKQRSDKSLYKLFFVTFRKQFHKVKNGFQI